MPTARGCLFCGGGSCANAAIAAVEADPRYADVIHDCLVIDIRDVRRTDVDDRAVVEKVAALPIAALVTPAAVAVAVVDAAVESHLWSPVSRVPQEYRAISRPVSGRP